MLILIVMGTPLAMIGALYFGTANSFKDNSPGRRA